MNISLILFSYRSIGWWNAIVCSMPRWSYKYGERFDKSWCQCSCRYEGKHESVYTIKVKKLLFCIFLINCWRANYLRVDK